MGGGRCRRASPPSKRCCVLRTARQLRIGDCGLWIEAARCESEIRNRQFAIGFTLIEILVVITVIAIMAGLVAPMVFRNVGDAKVSAAKAQLELFALALDAYRLDNDFYPSPAQGLAALRPRPDGEPEARNWRGPYLRKEIPADP